VYLNVFLCYLIYSFYKPKRLWTQIITLKVTKMTNNHDRKHDYFKFNGISYKKYILYALQAFFHSTRKESVLLMMNDTTATAHLECLQEYDVKYTLMCISHLDQLKAPLITLWKGRYIKCIILLLLLLTALA